MSVRARKIIARGVAALEHLAHDPWVADALPAARVEAVLIAVGDIEPDVTTSSNVHHAALQAREQVPFS